MKLSSTGLALALASIVVANSDDDYASAASSDYWAGYDPTDVAPADCAKPTAFFDCYKVVSKYAHCTDDACNCSSVMIDQSCIEQNCNLPFDTVDSTRYCTGTATKGMNIGAQKTPSPSVPASTEATATPAPTAAGQTATGSGTASGTAASKPNAGERSMRVSAGGLFAVAAAAVGSLLYRL